MTMLKSTKTTDFSLPVNFKIEVNGFIDEHFIDYFGEFSITHKRIDDDKMVSCLRGNVLDQAALIGILNLLYDMRFPIISVKTMKKKRKSKKRKSVKL